MVCCFGSGRLAGIARIAAGEDTISARGSILAALILAACARAPALEVADARFLPPFVGLPERAAQIERAGAGLGWQTVRVASNRIRASSDAAGKGIVVSIDFDAATFAIRYEDSRELATVDLDQNVSVARLRDAIIAQSGV
jgi:hypothetical protein